MSKKRKINTKNWITAYNEQISNGTVTVGRWVRLVYEYIVAGLQEGRFIFDEEKANAAVEWMESHCFHTKGPLAPQPIKLELWQKAMISAIFGILDADGNRQFQEVLLVVGRKNGKSKIASGVADYIWQKEGGYGAEVYCIAPKLDQAEIVYSDVWQMVTLDPEYVELKNEIDSERDEHNKKVNDDSILPKRRQRDLAITAINSTVKKIAFSAKKSDGFNPSLCICDEIAAWEGDKGLKQYEVMASAMGARPDGMLLSCTTSGYVNDSIFDELMKRSTRFLMGDSKETHLLPFIYMIDDIEKWDDLGELRKANPNLGISVTEKFMLGEIAKAEGSLSKKAEFLTKYACVKQNSSMAWLSAQSVERMCGAALVPEDFRGCYCVGGIDLSQTRDLTACCVVVEREGELYVLARFFLPAEKIDEATQRDGVPYGLYVQRGLLTLSGDNYVDYHDCFDWFRMVTEEYQILPLKVGYDRYSAQYLVQDMKAYGWHMDDVFQGENLYPVIQEAEGLIEDGKLHIGDNDLLKMHLLNSAVKMSVERGRGKLVKLNPSLHIDGCAALLDALTVRQKWYAEIGEQLKNET